MGNNFAIKNYLDADKVTKELDALIKKPIYSIKPEALKKYEREYPAAFSITSHLTILSRLFLPKHRVTSFTI